MVVSGGHAEILNVNLCMAPHIFSKNKLKNQRIRIISHLPDMLNPKICYFFPQNIVCLSFPPKLMREISQIYLENFWVYLNNCS